MAKVKVPKRVAGVKVPKKVRKQAKKAIKAAESPMVREFAAAAIGAAARRARASAGAVSMGGTVSTETVVGIDADELAETVRAAALDGLRRFLEGFEEGLREIAAAADEAGRRRREEASGPEAGAAAE